MLCLANQVIFSSVDCWGGSGWRGDELGHAAGERVVRVGGEADDVPADGARVPGGDEGGAAGS